MPIELIEYRVFIPVYPGSENEQEAQALKNPNPS